MSTKAFNVMLHEEVYGEMCQIVPDYLGSWRACSRLVDDMFSLQTTLSIQVFLNEDMWACEIQFEIEEDKKMSVIKHADESQKAFCYALKEYIETLDRFAQSKQD